MFCMYKNLNLRINKLSKKCGKECNFLQNVLFFSSITLNGDTQNIALKTL